MSIIRGVAAIAIAALASGCATVISGTTQTVTLNSEPTGAACTVERDGSLLGRFVTPGSVTVGKNRSGLTITCRKDGYAPVIGTDPSDINGWVTGNLLLGVLPAGIDFLDGADAFYQQNVIVRMHPLRPDPYAPPAEPPTALDLVPAPLPTDPGT